MMYRSIKSLLAILVVLLAGTAAQAELKLVANFDGMSGTPDGQACNGVLGGTLDTESENTGNTAISTTNGSTVINVIGHSSGTMSRAIGVYGITNPIDKGETGIGFFRFMVTTGGTVRSHVGLISTTGTNPITSTNAGDPKTVSAGFRLVDNGSGFDLVTVDGATVLKTGLARSQWYSVWIDVDHAAETFDLYVSETTGPAGAAARPTVAALVQTDIPFGTATSGSLNGMIFANPISPTGSGQATRIYIDEIWWDGDQGLPKPNRAKNPSPADKEEDVANDVTLGWTPGPLPAVHDVYLGTSLDNVINASRTNPLDTFTGTGLDTPAFQAAQLLEFGRTYYWRVDEVNTSPDATMVKGAIWSFTVEPRCYPILNVTATASSSSEGMGPEQTVGGVGLDAGDQHSTNQTEMWLTAPDAPGPAWIQYEFDAPYKLVQLQVWNYNQLLESSFGLGAKNVTVEYSTDGAAWETLGDLEFAQAPGAATYTANTTVDFGGVIAQYVKLTIHSNWKSVLAQYGLSEVRFLYLPVLPRIPVPAAGQAGMPVDTVLSWRAGREAASHQVSFSTDLQAVTAGTAPVQTVSDNRFDPGPLNLGTTYYWKVIEVNEAQMPNTWAGEVWSFTTQEYAAIDDFESYNDVDTVIFATWLDNYDPQAAVQQGAQVGQDAPPWAERMIVHSGKQSMPLRYNNAGPKFFYSETSRDFGSAQDWTRNGADSLSLWVRGRPAAYVDNAGTITMSGAGHDIWDAADDFRFAWKSLTGNASIVVKVESLTNTDRWAKAGVMIRQSLDADSKFAYMIVSYSQGVSFGYRQVVAAPPDSNTVSGVAAPRWVKLTRTGDAFTAQYSADGITWLDVKNDDGTIATRTVSMTGPVYIGLCVTSHNAAATAVAVMSGVAATGNITGDWQIAAIGDDPEPANDPADFCVTVQDTTGKTATATNATLVTTADWTQWQIPLTSFTGVNMTKVRKLYLGVGNRANPTAGGAGQLYIDDIGFGHPAAQ